MYNINIKTITGFILICLLFSPQNVIAEGSHFNEVEQLSLDNEKPSIKELEALLNKYIKINDELNKKSSYDSSIIKFIMSESILNGIVFNLINDVNSDNTEKVCGFLDSSKELFVDVKYNLSILLKELDYGVKEVPMSASKNSFSSMGYWKEAMRIVKSEDFNQRLKEYSENKGVVSLNDHLAGKSKIKQFPTGWSNYRSRPEFSQYINAYALTSYWAKHKIYCIYKKLESKYAGDDLYDALVTEASADPWLSGKNRIHYNKHILKDTINLTPTGTPQKIQTFRLVDAPEWK